MFPKKNRITKSEFSEIIKKGRAFHSPLFSLRSVKNDNEHPSKFAFVISKKVARNAVERNVMKRRGFHTLRDIIFHSEIVKMKGFTVAFFFKKEGKSVSYDVLKTEIRELLKKGGVLQ